MDHSWHPGSWRQFKAAQQPKWNDEAGVKSTIKKIASYPPLVFAGEADTLKSHIAKVSRGEAFLLQGGDCAESFDNFDANAIRDKLKVLLQMAVVLTYASSKPVIKIGRIAGQFAKPRSNDLETIGDETYPSFRGDAVNSADFNAVARKPDPQRLETAYFQSAAILNLLRAFTGGGFADLNQVHLWNRDFVSHSPQGKRYAEVADNINGALKFMAACGINSQNTPMLHDIDYYTSHEALILEYEQALTRQDSISGNYYDCSAHMLWIGERTHQIDGAHLEFLRGVKNPIACKVGPNTPVDEVLKLTDLLNPANEAGRLTLIVRFGCQKIEASLPPVIAAIEKEGRNVAWCCDPMHGNTYTAAGGRKTRSFSDLLQELTSFFAIHKGMGTVPGGVHFELTGDDVTECIGGNSSEITVKDLEYCYTTTCDPRLNCTQSLDLAFLIGELLKK